MAKWVYFENSWINVDQIICFGIVQTEQPAIRLSTSQVHFCTPFKTEQERDKEYERLVKEIVCDDEHPNS